MKVVEYDWKEQYDSAKTSDLETLKLPSNYAQLTIEQKEAINTIFYSVQEEDSHEIVIQNLRRAISEIEDSIYDLENR